MKKFFLFVAFFTALIFVVSCGDGSKKDNKTDSPDTEENTADEETADTGSTDTDELTEETGSTDNDSGDKTDSGNDNDTTPDNTDTTPVSDDDADTDDDTISDGDEDTADTIPDDDEDGINKDLPEKNFYMGLMAFNEELFVKEIGLLDNSTLNDYNSFVDNLIYDDSGYFHESALYYADYTALGMLRDYLVPSDLEKVVLITMVPPRTDLLESFMIGCKAESWRDDCDLFDPEHYDPGHYGQYNDDPDYDYYAPYKYQDAIHDIIVNEKIHGKKVEAYAIGWDSVNIYKLRPEPEEEEEWWIDYRYQDEIKQMVLANMKKMSSCDESSENCDDYVFIASSADEMYDNLMKIAEKIYADIKMSKLDVSIPDEYQDGQRLRLVFDTYYEKSDLYIEATYRRTGERTLEDIEYYGIAGNTPIVTGSPDGDFHHFVFKDLKYEDGTTPLSKTDLSRAMLAKETSPGKWEKEPAFDHSNVFEKRYSTLVMFLLDFGTSNAEYINGNMKEDVKSFMDLLANLSLDFYESNIDTATKVCIELIYSQDKVYWGDDRCLRKADCPDKPETTSWNYASWVLQEWTGVSWQPEAITVYNETPDGNSCRYTCKDDKVWTGSECVRPTLCYPNNPCDSIDNSTGECTEQKIYDEYFGYLGTVYICGCKQGYLWNEDDLQCRQIPTTFSECNTEDTTLLSLPCKDSTDYIWSELYKEMTWQQAKNHCSNLNSLNYGGFSSGWHLPTVDELRTLIKNCDDTKSGGICRVTKSCLTSYCWDLDDCSCTRLAFPKYSKFGDKEMLWSSSAVSNYSDLAWFVNFSDASVRNTEMSDPIQFRCVR